MSILMQFLAGILLAAVVAMAALRLHSLSRSGAWTAWLVGTIIFGLGGWQWALLLLTFFISSSLLTRFLSKRKTDLKGMFEKGGQRDRGQVLANGAIASLFTGLHFFLPQAEWPWMAFAASLAAVNADTWATELGVLNPSLPRLITNGRSMEKGTSGAVSLYGFLAMFAGAALIALLAGWLRPAGGFFNVAGVVLLGGLAGALFDSLLGATVQGIYRCPKCRKETERHPLHACGIETQLLRGWQWLDNDLVNLACASLGALIGLIS